MGLHLLHHPGAMDLDRALAQVQVASDDLVGLAGHDQVEDFALARLRQFVADVD